MVKVGDPEAGFTLMRLPLASGTLSVRFDGVAAVVLTKVRDAEFVKVMYWIVVEVALSVMVVVKLPMKSTSSLAVGRPLGDHPFTWFQPVNVLLKVFCTAL